MMGLSLIPPNEEAYIENLKKYKIIYTKSEPVFDQLAAITATMLDTPIAMINFVDKYKVWTKAGQNGESGQEVERDISLCSLAILNDSLAVFGDLAKEFFLISNPLVAGEHGFKFYAAAPITTDEGFNVGTVCVVDKTSHIFGEAEREKLKWVSSMITGEMNKRIALFSVA